MFRIKICGVTSIDDAITVAESGADAVGLNFFAKSPRSVSVELAKAIREAVPSLTAVGVFVNTPAGELRQVAKEVGLSAIQLHGDEPPETVAELAGLKVILARRMDQRGVTPIAEDLHACEAAGKKPDAVLIDAAVKGEYGGTGKTIDWASLAGDRGWLLGVPLVLAGGLTPDNVAEAIEQVTPHGVDTASGVESSPGIKDARQVANFVAAARRALPDSV